MSYNKFTGYKLAYDYGNDTEYDHSHFMRFISDQDFESAANYAEQFMPDNDPKGLIDRKIAIENIRRKGSIFNKVMTSIKSPEDREAYSFKFAFDNGFELPKEEENRYTKLYNQLIDSLGSTEKQTATSLRLVINNEDNSDWLSSLLGVNDDGKTLDLLQERSGVDFKSLGSDVSYSFQGGKHVIEFNKNSKDFRNIIKALSSSGINLNNINLAGVGANGRTLNYLYGEQSVFGDYNLSNFVSSGEPTNYQKYYTSPLKQLGMIFKSLNNVSETKEVKDNLKTQSSIYTVPVQFPGKEDLDNALAAGAIKQEFYNSRVKEMTQYYGDRILANWSQNEGIYTNNDKDDVLRKINDSEESMNLRNTVSTAMRQDRVSFYLGNMGGQYGVFINILAGKEDEKVNVKESNKERNKMIFIPGLEKEAAYRGIEAKPETRVLREMENMRVYGYTHKFNDGSTVSSLNNEGGYFIDALDPYNQPEFKTSEEIKNKMYEDYKDYDTAQYIANSIYDNKGNIDNRKLEKVKKEIIVDLYNNYINLYGNFLTVEEITTKAKLKAYDIFNIIGINFED